MIGCGSSDGDSNTQDDASNSENNNIGNQTSRLVSMTMNSQLLMQDSTINLEWVNGA